MVVQNLEIQYLTDKSGNKTAIQIAYEDWIEIEKKLKEYVKYQNLKEGLLDSFREVKRLKQHKEKE